MKLKEFALVGLVVALGLGATISLTHPTKTYLSINKEAEVSRTPQTKISDTLFPTTEPTTIVQDQPIFTPWTFMSQDLPEWQAIEAQILNSPGDVTINLQGYGGMVIAGQEFINVIQQAQAKGKKIHINVIGPAYSMHAAVTCYADSVTILPGAGLMFHAAASYKTILFGLITYRDTSLGPLDYATETTINKQCVDKGFLDKADLKVLDEGRDVNLANVAGSLIKTHNADDSGATIISVFTQLLPVVIDLAAFFAFVGVLTLMIRRSK